MAQAKRDDNYVPTLLGVSNSDQTTPVVLWADPTTHRLLVDSNVTEYTEGDTDASITGIAIMWEDTSDTLRAVSAAKPLPITEASPSAIVAFITDIPTAGTRVQLASNTVIAGVLQAPSTNSGNVFIGGSDVSSTVFGAELQAGQSVGVAIDNTNLIHIDAATSGDDVAFIGS